MRNSPAVSSQSETAAAGQEVESLAADLFIIQNPAAGLGNGERVRRRIVAELSARQVSHRLSYTSESGHAEDLAREALAQGCRRIAVAGGDGTVLEVVSAVVGTDAQIALLPVGTGNQLAANLGIPRRLGRAVEVAVRGVTRKIDVGMLNGRPFTIMAGAGLDAEVVRAEPRLKRRVGYLAYVYAAARAILKPRTATLRVTIDGQVITARGMGVEVANMPGLTAPIFRRPIRIMPDLAADDGRLGVCVLGTETAFGFLSALTAIFIGRHRQHRKLQYFTGREVTVEADPPLPAQVDGELRGTTPFRATVRPRALNVIVPAG